ncbi:hypothetical protein T09_3179 [Trichinella sp. T9]|nr:hypothetical protein T09_3179 [Trichinella sp. T9]
MQIFISVAIWQQQPYYNLHQRPLKAAATVLLLCDFWQVCNLVYSCGSALLWSSCLPSAGFYIGCLSHAITGFSGICFIHFCQCFCHIQDELHQIFLAATGGFTYFKISFLLEPAVHYCDVNCPKKYSSVPFSTAVVYSVQCSQHARQIYASMYFLYSFTIIGQNTSTKWRVLQSVPPYRTDRVDAFLQ